MARSRTHDSLLEERTLYEATHKFGLDDSSPLMIQIKISKLSNLEISTSLREFLNSALSRMLKEHLVSQITNLVANLALQARELQQPGHLQSFKKAIDGLTLTFEIS